MTKKEFTQEELTMLNRVEKVLDEGMIAEVHMNNDGTFTVWAKEETAVWTDMKKW